MMNLIMDLIVKEEIILENGIWYSLNIVTREMVELKNRNIRCKILLKGLSLIKKVFLFGSLCYNSYVRSNDYGVFRVF